MFSKQLRPTRKRDDFMKKLLFLMALLCCFALESCDLSTSAEEQLKATVEEVNNKCPMRVDEFTICDRIFTENRKVVYQYLVDENFWGTTLQERNDVIFQLELKSSLEDNLESAKYNENLMSFLELIDDAGYDLVYRYIGSVSGFFIDVRFPNEELSGYYMEEACEVVAE